MSHTRIRATVAAVAIATALFTPTTAEAGQPQVTREGGCQGIATWKLKAQQQDRRVAVEFEVDTNRRGQRWRVKLFQNGRQVSRNVATTRGASGSFTVRRVRPDRRGNDRFRVRATRIGSGQTCVGRVRYRF